MDRPPDNQLLARFIAEQAVRNSVLEDYHAGITPSSKTGDYSDVYVVSPYGKIPWKEVSRISDPEMRVLMLEVEAGIAKCLAALNQLDDNGYEALLTGLQQHYFGAHGVSWDNPQHRGRTPEPSETSDSP